MKINELFQKPNTAKNAAGSENEGGGKGGADRPVWYKRPWVHKLLYAFIALIISVTLWGYVLMSENPSRSLRIENIPVTFEAGSESDLYARNLTIVGNIDEILPSISVFVKTTLNDLPRFKGRETDIVKATVSLNSVHSAGEHSLAVNVTTSIGEIERISIDNIVVTVDNLVERTIPVSAHIMGELPEGYWHDEVQLLTNSVQIRGAESELQSIVKAGCVIDLSGRTEAINDSFTLNLYDINDQLVTTSSLTESIPAVTVRMNILPKLDIPLSANIIGQSAMKDIYEITQILIQPATVSIAADRAILEQLPDLISLESIDVANIDDECTLNYEVRLIGMPEGAILINGIDTFSVTIEVRERIEEVTFESMPVSIINEDTDSFSYQYSPSTAAVTLRGKASLIRSLYSMDIRLTLNMAGNGIGTYTLIPELELLNGKQEYLFDLEYTVTPVTCTVTAAQNE